MKDATDEGGGGKYKTSCIVLNPLEFSSAASLTLSGWKNRSGRGRKRCRTKKKERFAHTAKGGHKFFQPRSRPCHPSA